MDIHTAEKIIRKDLKKSYDTRLLYRLERQRKERDKKRLLDSQFSEHFKRMKTDLFNMLNEPLQAYLKEDNDADEKDAEPIETKAKEQPQIETKNVDKVTKPKSSGKFRTFF